MKLTLPERLYSWPEDEDSCSVKELALPLSGECTTTKYYSTCGHELPTDQARKYEDRVLIGRINRRQQQKKKI